jgi:hypothetical protein
MAHVHCGSDQGACFRLAGNLCPSGYEIKPVLSGSDGNFLIRCRAATAAASAAVCPRPASNTAALALTAPRVVTTGAAVRTTAGSQGWPPATEPWPSAYPWPPPETNAVVAPVPAPPAGQELDLGY